MKQNPLMYAIIGDIVGSRYERAYFKTRKVTIECEDELVTDIDGEKGPDFPLTIECVRNGIQLLGYE